MPTSGACRWTGFVRGTRLLRKNCSPPFARRWIRPSRRTGSRSPSSPTVQAIGTYGREVRTAPGCGSLRPNLFCHFIPRGLPTAVKSHSTPRRSARVRSGSSMPPEGGPWRLVAMPGGAQVPSWSRDGKRILFYTNAEGTRQIWEVAATGGAPVQLTHGGSYDPSESSDGHYLYYGSVLSPGVWRVPLEPRLPDGSLANQEAELIRETLPVTRPSFLDAGSGRDLLCGRAEDAGGFEVRRSGIAQSDGHGHPRQATGKVHQRSFDLARRALRIVLPRRRRPVRNPRGGKLPLAHKATTVVPGGPLPARNLKVLNFRLASSNYDAKWDVVLILWYAPLYARARAGAGVRP